MDRKRAVPTFAPMRAMPETAASTIVALTGYGQPEDKARALQAGFDRHLVKPVAIDDLVSIVSQKPA